MAGSWRTAERCLTTAPSAMVRCTYLILQLRGGLQAPCVNFSSMDAASMSRNNNWSDDAPD